MRKLVAYELLTLDGIAEHPEEFVTEWDVAMDENLEQAVASQDAVLLGRRTYDEWANFWPTSDNEPFASFINPVAKYVVTSSPLARAWENVTVLDDVAASVQRLKEQDGGDIGLHGSIALTQSLLAAGLVDELRLVIVPTVHARGRKLFDNVGPARFACAGCVVSPTGALLLNYELRS